MSLALKYEIALRIGANRGGRWPTWTVTPGVNSLDPEEPLVIVTLHVSPFDLHEHLSPAEAERLADALRLCAVRARDLAAREVTG